MSHSLDPLPPPSKILLLVSFPDVMGYTPILSPFHCEGLRLEIHFWRCAPGPFQVKNVGIRPCIHAVSADAKWNVAHQLHFSTLGIGFYFTPLTKCDPLHKSHKLAV